LRIAYLVSQYPAVNTVYILREITQLRRAGFDVRVISIRPPDRPPDGLTPVEREEMRQTTYVTTRGLLGVLASHLATLATRPLAYGRGFLYALRFGRFDLRRTAYALAYFAEAVVVGDWMRRQRLAHAHVHYSSTVALFATRIFPITISITIHGSDEFVDPVGHRLAAKVAAARFVCAISNYGRSQIMKACDYTEWPKIEVARLGIDPESFAPAPVRERPVPFEVICVGQLAPAKGQHILLAAVQSLVHDERQVLLRLVGDGDDRAGLEADAAARGIDDRVVFEGSVNQDRLRALYQRADACVLPSFAEGVPVVLMEAMSMGIPCVASRITGIPELIEDGVHGLLVDPSDSALLAAAIARLMGDATLRRRLGAAARTRVMERYDLARNTRHLAEIFRRRLAADESTARTPHARAPSLTAAELG
jgi:glycosyltransferase involved in cell wall biosynthesis